MQFPALLPHELRYCESASNEDELLSLLLKKPPDLILFFETACDDETWSETHANFMKKVIDWITVKAFQDRLSAELCVQAAKSIRKHFSILNPFVPENIQIKLKDKEIRINSLLLSTISNFFKQIIFKECKDKNSPVFSLPVTYQKFIPFEQFVCIGSIPDLWKKGQDEIISLLRQAILWEVKEIDRDCEEVLIKYLTRENAFDMLLTAHGERWPIFKQGCIDFINRLGLGFRFYAPSIDRLGFEFENFSDPALDHFQRFCNLLTDLACCNRVSENPLFSKVVRQCPKMIMLDISGSPSFSDYLLDIPIDLQGLNLSQCPWVSKVTLKRLSKICPSIKELRLCSNIHLNYAAWGGLIDFKQLKSLDLSRCHQIGDEDLAVILKACRNLVDLSLDECKNIDDRGFFGLAKNAPQIVNLNLSRCSISDVALIEIATRCRALITLNISRCEHITERGVLEFAKHSAVLKELNLTHCNVPMHVIAEIKRLFPYLTLIF